jgi:endonuclease III
MALVAGLPVIGALRRAAFRGRFLGDEKDPIKVEFELMEIIPKDRWRLFSNLLISHGRAVCTARKPRHNECKVVDFCKEGIRWKY